MVYLLRGSRIRDRVADPIGAFEKRRPWVWPPVRLSRPGASGVFFEAIGDRQMERVPGPTANKGGVIDVASGGTPAIQTTSATVRLVGIFLVAADHWPGVNHLCADPDDLCLRRDPVPAFSRRT